MADPILWVDVEDLLRSTGARNLSRSGNEFSFSCFSGTHLHGDHSPSAGMNATTTLWRCRNPACGLHGNAVDYIVALHGYTRAESERVLRERYGGPELSTEAGALEREVLRIRAAADEIPARKRPSWEFYRETFGVDWYTEADLPPLAYMRGRGFDAQTLSHWHIGYDSLSDRITIPVVDETGLVGIKGRAWRPDHQPRYLIIGDAAGRPPRYDFDTYQKSEFVFGIHQARGSVVVLEGELNAIALNAVGIPAVAVAGAEFSERQREIIVTHCSDAVIWFDADPGGRAGLVKVAHALHPFMPLRIVLEPPADAAELLRQRRIGMARQLVAHAVPFLQAVMTNAV